ncbi:MAG: response regulator [Desulfobacula sp.]|jgi:response regulator RpfG family c-di-GMP phosphodiesterase|nr:response regulator [Desulfobacula sp.]
MNQKQRILIVDDTPSNLKVLNDLLTDSYHISVATNGPDTFKFLSSNNYPDLILLDVMMPGMDGFEVARILRADEKAVGIPIIFITAKTDIQSITQGFASGGNDYITKPIQPEELLARVKTHLALKTAQDKIIIQNQKLKNQARQLFDFGAQKKALVEKMASEVTKAVTAITKERGDYIKSIADILQKATQEDNHQQLIDLIKQTREDSIQKIEQLPLKKVSLLGLQPGMITAKEIRDKKGRCLLNSGSMITEGLIESLLSQSSEKDIFVIC